MAERIIERDALSMYEHDQCLYSIVVNRRRAFPMIKDGLKPVQRRIIYVAFKMGLVTAKKKKKCQALVGEVMGNYHAHGDSCLDGSTVLYLLNGSYITIEDAYKMNANLEILAIDPNTMQVIPTIAHSFRIGQYTDQIYHIKFSNGYEIKCTANHPFMLPDGSFIRADNLHPYMRIETRFISFNSKSENDVMDDTVRPMIDGILLQNIVGDYYQGPVPNGYIRHHKDFNSLNNSLDNLQVITRDEHRLIHDANRGQIYLDGLAKGRESMKNDPYIHHKNMKKNAKLMELYMKDHAMRKFKMAVNILIERGLPITIDNYESLRNEIYNLPIIERIIKRHPEYNCNSFEDLVNYQISSVGELYTEYKNSLHSPFVFEKRKEVKSIIVNRSMMFDKIDKMVDNDIPLSVENYYNFSLTTTTPDIVSNAINQYIQMRPFITDISIENVNQIPMYDFTVDNVQNMLIPLGNTNGTIAENIVGSVMPMISAHNSIYEADVVLAAWFKTKYLLIYGHGNFGSVSGSGAASSRYTECALSEFGYDILIDELSQSKNIVNWQDTFLRDGTMEPEYLPAKLPLILLNGSIGIGVGMSINVPSHNLGEVIDVMRVLLVNPNAKFCLIPDLCQPCELMGDNWEEINELGRGTFKARGIITQEEDKKGNLTLHIVSLPTMVTTSDVYTKILAMCEKKELPMVKDVIESVNTKDEHPDIIIHLKPGSDPNYVKQVLYAKTDVQKSISVNFEAVGADGINPGRFSYRQYLLEFINHRITTKFRLYANKLQQFMTRHHKLDAFIKVLTSGELDTIIKMIRKEKSTDDTVIIEYMIKKCGVTDIQADFIIHTNLANLSMGHLKKYIEENNWLINAIEEYKAKANEASIRAEIDNELVELKKKYNTPRLCRVISTAEENNIPAGIFKIVVTEKNFLRKIPDTDKVGIVRKDNPKFVIRIDNTDNLLVFDNKGKVFSIPVSKIPMCDKTSAGTDIRLLVRYPIADIINIFAEPIFNNIIKSGNKHYLTVLTKYNCIKKLDLEDFLNIPLSGLIYSKLTPEDYVVGLALVPHNLDIVIGGDKKALRFNLKDVPVLKRAAMGCKAMDTDEPLEGMSVIYPNAKYIIVVTKNGKFNRFNAIGMATHSRARKGNNVIKLDPNDNIVAILGASDNDIVHIVGVDSIYDIPVSDIKEKSAIAPGVKMINDMIIKADIIMQS